MSNTDRSGEIQADPADPTRGILPDERSMPNSSQHGDHQKDEKGKIRNKSRSETDKTKPKDYRSTANNHQEPDQNGGSTGHLPEVAALQNLIEADLRSVKNTKDNVSAYEDAIDELSNKFDKLKAEMGSVEEFRELKKAMRMLERKITSGQKEENPDSGTNQSLKSNMAKVDLAKADKVAHQMPNLNKNPNFDESPEFRDFEARYLELKDELRLCLLCFAVFPENEEIKKKVMMHWWIGEGFVPPVERKNTELDYTPEKFASEYFNELVAKGFVEPVYGKRSLKVETCKMHPLVQSMVIRIAKRANFFNFNPGWNAQEVYTSCLRACLTGKVLTKPDDKEMFDNLENLHTMFNVSQTILDFDPEWLAKMKNINVLYLGRWQTKATHHIEVEDTKTLKKKDAHVLDGLENMKHLRFLSLQGVSQIVDLPKTISKLTNLTILDLRACHNLEVIPKEIGRLKKLTHLDMSECYLLDQMPQELANLSELQVLSGFVVGDLKSKSCTLDNLKKLSNLRKLSIHTGRDDFPSKEDMCALYQFSALTKLTIAWGRGSVKAKSNEPGSQAPAGENKEDDKNKGAQQSSTEDRRSDPQAVQTEPSPSNQGAGALGRENSKDGKEKDIGMAERKADGTAEPASGGSSTMAATSATENKEEDRKKGISEAEEPITAAKRSGPEIVQKESSASNQGAGTPSSKNREDGKEKDVCMAEQAAPHSDIQPALPGSSASKQEVQAPKTEKEVDGKWKTSSTEKRVARNSTFSRVTSRLGGSSSKSPSPALLPEKLVKLDLQCFPNMIAPSWLRPWNLRKLKKLYVRGGKFSDLGQFQDFVDGVETVSDADRKWNVEELRLKYLTELEMDWTELQELFPRLEYLEKVDCPLLSLCPCDASGVWARKKRLTT